MRICVVGSCGKKKLRHSERAPTCKDLTARDALSLWQQRLAALAVEARDMYVGNQTRELVKGVDALRTIDGVDVDLFIVSAGFGLLAEHEPVPPYDCTFTGMKKQSILFRAKRLRIPDDFEKVCRDTRYDLIYLALGKNYILALGRGWLGSAHGAVVSFDSKLAGRDVVMVPCGNSAVRSFSQQGHKIHGAVGFKGDLLRILVCYALGLADPYDEVSRWSRPAYLQDLIHALGGLQ